MDFAELVVGAAVGFLSSIGTWLFQEHVASGRKESERVREGVTSLCEFIFRCMSRRNTCEDEGSDFPAIHEKPASGSDGSAYYYVLGQLYSLSMKVSSPGCAKYLGLGQASVESQLKSLVKELEYCMEKGACGSLNCRVLVDTYNALGPAVGLSEWKGDLNPKTPKDGRSYVTEAARRELD